MVGASSTRVMEDHQRDGAMPTRLIIESESDSVDFEKFMGELIEFLETKGLDSPRIRVADDIDLQHGGFASQADGSQDPAAWQSVLRAERIRSSRVEKKGGLG